MKRLILKIAFWIYLSLAGTWLYAETDDEGYLVSTLQEMLSDAGRDVDIVGFEGALSSSATMQALKISDQDGLWFEAQDLVLDWQQSALLLGRIKINRLQIGKIILYRSPNAEQSALPSPETSQFELPDLPVSVEIALLELSDIELHEAILGTPLRLSLTGQADLKDGSGQARLSMRRIDGKTGLFDFDGAYSAQTRQLRLNLNATEEAEGIVAQSLNIPDAPALALTLKGDAPIDDFTAKLSLLAEGQPKLRGQFRQRFDQEGQAFWSGTLSGDIASLFAPEYQAFFGASQNLTFQAEKDKAGRFKLPNLALKTQRLDISGQIVLDAGGRPFFLDLRGLVEAPDQVPVLLPIAGASVFVSQASFAAELDREKSPDMRVNARIADLQTDLADIPETILRLRGVVEPDKFDANLDLIFDKVAWSDPALSDAAGQQAVGELHISNTEQGVWHISDLLLTTDNGVFSGNISFDPHATPVRSDFSLALKTPAFNTFSALAGLPLSGSGELALAGTFFPLEAGFDVDLSGRTQALSIGNSILDPALHPETALKLQIARDAKGLQLRHLDLQNQLVSLSLKGNAATTQSRLDLQAAIRDIADWTPVNAPRKWQGGAQISGSLQLSGTSLRGAALQIENLGPELRFTQGRDVYSSQGLRIATRFAENIWQMRGGLTRLSHPFGRARSLTLEGDGRLRLSAANIPIAASAAMQLQGDLSGPSTANWSALIKGPHRVALDADYDQTNGLNIQKAEIIGNELRFSGQGNLPDSFRFDGGIRNMGVLVAEFPGPLDLTGSLLQNSVSNGWKVNTQITGPRNGNLSITGNIRNAESVSLNARGDLPLAYANGFLKVARLSGAARLDLQLNGAPKLANLVGELRSSNGALALPAAKMRIENMQTRLSFDQSRAVLFGGGDFNKGGRVALEGDIDLNAPFVASISGRLSDVKLSDPQLFSTIINGPFSISGALSDGALIKSDLILRSTEIAIPSSTVGGFGTVPEITHQAQSAKISETLRRAGLAPRPRLRDDPAPSKSGGFPLDIRISSPSQIFIRGRGLDAELGGAINFTGTTANIAPRGSLDLIRGRLAVLSERINVTEGRISLLGDFDPTLYFRADLQRDDTTLSTIISGRAREPEITFTSSPALPEDEVFAKIVFDRDLSDLSPLQTVQLVAAIAELSGRGGVSIISNIRKKLRLDDLDLIQQQNGEIALKAGKYVNDRTYSAVTIDSDGNQKLDLNIRLNDELNIRGRADTDKNNSIGIFYDVDF